MESEALEMVLSELQALCTELPAARPRASRAICAVGELALELQNARSTLNSVRTWMNDKQLRLANVA